jgi:UTP--glucose-1-phosphate uridylyltransferase
MSRKIRKAVIPVGGLGTRFLPATKAMPKEMLPVVDKPIIQYAYEEAVKAGIEQFVFITGRNKYTITNHFDKAYELESVLDKEQKKAQLELTTSWLPDAGNIAFIRQQHPLGLGHAIWCARNFVGDEPFVVILPDVVLHETGFLKKLVSEYEENGGNIIAVNEIPYEQTNNYGVIAPDGKHGNLTKITDMVEKPEPEDAPSNLSILGRYILDNKIFEHLKNTSKGAGGEIQLTDAMVSLMKEQPFYAMPYEGKRFDCGSKIGFLEANLAFALERPDLRERVLELLKQYQ